MRNKFIFGAALAAIVVGSAMLYQSTMAYRGNASTFGPNYTPERHEQMQKAFENNDYNAWKNLMNGRGRVSQVVTEQNFPRFAEMHRLMQEGKIDDANKIRQELGLGQGMGMGCGNGRTGAGQGRMMGWNR